MKRNVKNEKVLRAISIGLATMIAVTSTPITVFAEDGTQQEASESNSGQSEGEGQTSENETSEGSEEVTAQQIENIQSDITSKDEAGENPGVSQAIDNAQDEVAKIPTLTDVVGNDTAAEYLQTAEDAVDDNKDETGEIAQPENKETMDYLEDLKKGLEQNDAAQQQAKKDAQAINNTLDSLVVAELEPVVDEDGNQVLTVNGYDTDGNAIYTPQMQVVYKNAFGEAVNKIEENLKNTAENVKTANESDSEEAAKAAAKAANNTLRNVADGIEDADKAIDAARKGAQEANEDLRKKQEAFDNATVELARLQESLDGAKTESKKSHDAVVKAQEKVNALKIERDEAFKESDEAELTLVAAVYEKFNTVDADQKEKSQKYHDKLNALSSDKKDQYNAWKSYKSVDGLTEEDIKLFEEVKGLYTEASKAYTQAWVEAGNLSKALIKYYISHEDGYVKGSFKISGGIDGEGYGDIAPDLLGYSRTIGDTYTISEETIDDNGNPVNKYERIDTKYDFPDAMGYEFKKDTGWVVNYSVDNGTQPNNVVVVRYQTKVAEVDENGNPKTNEDGSPVYQTKDVERYYNVKRDKGFCFFERFIDVVDGEVIEAKEGQKAIDGYYVLGEDGKPVGDDADKYLEKMQKGLSDTEKKQGRYKAIESTDEKGAAIKILCGDMIEGSYKEGTKVDDSYNKDGASWWEYSIDNKTRCIVETKKQNYKKKNGSEIIQNHIEQTTYYNPKVFTKYHQDEVVGNNSITLQKLQFSTDDPKEAKDVKDASIVKSFIEYRKAVSELNAATEAVDVAEKKTKKLMDDIAKLKVSAPKSEELEQLSARLEQSQKLLENAKDHRDELQKLYEDAKDAVDKIDLSRFTITVPVVVPDTGANSGEDTNPASGVDSGSDVRPVADAGSGAATDSDSATASDSDSDSDSGSDSVSSAYVEDGFTGAVLSAPAAVGTIGDPLVLTPAGITGIGTGTGAGTGTGNEGNTVGGVLGARTENPVATNNTNSKVENSEGASSDKSSEDKDYVKVDNPQTPLAETPSGEDNSKNDLWGLLLLGLAGLTGFGIYKADKRKKAAASVNSTKKDIK